MKTFVDEINVGARPTIARCVEALGDAIPAMHELASTPQDAGWHGEGNVLVHTGMVLDALYGLLDGPAASITGHRRSALILAAALHDIAKPTTTREVEIQGVRRITAPHHEMQGRSSLAVQLMGHGLDYGTVELTLDLVGYHIRPKFLVVKGRERGEYLRLAQCADPELLYWLELADMMGRVCDDRAQQIESIELFGLFAREYGAWTRFGDEAPQWRAMLRDRLPDVPAMRDLAYGQFIHDLCNGTITQPEEGIARSYRIRDGFPELVLPVGPSGSGKSTWLKQHVGDHLCISLDDIRTELGGLSDQSNNSRVLPIARERLREGLRRKQKIVWDATSLRRDFRDAVTDLARNYGALITIVCFPNSASSYHQRNMQREVPVPAAVLDRQIASLEWPERLEAHRWLAVDGAGQTLAYYGGLDEALPYGIKPRSNVLREPP